MKDFKACKGINKAHNFDGCGELVKANTRKAGLCRKCYYKWWLLNTPEGNNRINNVVKKVTKPRRDLEKAEQEEKEFNKLQSLLASVKNSCHRFIRERDKYKPCISCLTSWNKDFQAGHYYKAETYSSIKFHELNIHGQCRKCNLRKDGNYDAYRLNLPYRIGEEAFEEIEYLAQQDKKIKDFKWDREELKKLRTYYNQQYRKL